MTLWDIHTHTSESEDYLMKNSFIPNDIMIYTHTGVAEDRVNQRELVLYT